MKVSTRDIFSKGYFTLPDGNRIKVFTQEETGRTNFYEAIPQAVVLFV